MIRYRGVRSTDHSAMAVYVSAHKIRPSKYCVLPYLQVNITRLSRKSIERFA